MFKNLNLYLQIKTSTYFKIITNRIIIIKIIPNAKPKLSKVYFLSPIEQTELNVFIAENLLTG